MMKARHLLSGVLVMTMALGFSHPACAQSRNASFVNPGAVSQKAIDNKSSQANTLVADPASVDAGETLVNIARRVTVFFYNGFRSPIQINDLTLNADGNVRSRVLSDDCKVVKNLPVQDKCSVALEITPSSPGPWSVELLLNHSGSGRIARAEINGTTLGKADQKSEGLAISKKIAATLDFGTVAANEETAARTMLIENDSPMPLAISSIDLIASQQDGLSIRHNGCKEGDELKPGESCPITVLWEPTYRGKVATDLIVRHSGNLGFVVVPIRGDGSVEADKGEEVDPRTGKTTRTSNTASMMPRGSMDASQSRTSMPALDVLPLPGGLLKSGSRKAPPDIQKMAGVTRDGSETAEVDIPKMNLIGTVGRRAILGDAQEQTYMVNLGEKVSIAGQDVELLQLDPTRAVVMVSGKRIFLSLRNMQTIAYQSDERSDGDGSQEKSSKSDKSLAVHNRKGSPPNPLPENGKPGSVTGEETSNAVSAQDVLTMMK